MAFIKGNGAPNKDVSGAIGDTYIDIDTGNKYECTFAYITSNGDKSYDWKLISETKYVKTPQKPQNKFNNGVKK